MNSNREILTLQLGNYSNYIGAHWWNIQESGFSYDPAAEPSEIEHDILYREGVDYRGHTTFTPRLLLVELQGALGHLPEDGLLYDSTNVPSTSISEDTDPYENVKSEIPWESKSVEVIKKNVLKKNEFQKDLDNPDIDIDAKNYNLSQNVETWADFLYTRYHPRTINVVRKYQHSNDRESFDTFSNGVQLWNSEQFEDDFGDKIRQYVEECNNCQGFQTIFDSTNGFSGLSIKCLEYLNDEYSKATFAIPVFSPKSILFEKSDDPMTDSIRTVNIALTYSKLIEQSSVFLPLSTNDRAWRQIGNPRKFPFVNYKNDNLYQTSSILASYLDTISLRYRIRNPNYSSSLSSFCSDLTNYGRKLTAAAFSYPFQMRSDHDLIDCLDQFDGDIFTQLSPNSKIGTDYIVQSLCVRGIPKTRLKKPLQLAEKQMKMAAYRCESISEMFQLYFQCQNHASLAHVSALQTAIPIRTPYPSEIFDNRLNSEGFITDANRLDDQKMVSLPSVASIQCSGDLADTIESLHREAERIKIVKLHRFKETGLETDDYSEALEILLQFKDNYEDNYQL